MASLSSPVQKVEHVYFDRFPRRGIIVKKYFQAEWRIYLMSASGKLYTNDRSLGCNGHFIISSDYEWQKQSLEAYVALGLCSKSEADKHLRACKKVRERKNKEDDYDRAYRILKKLGLTVTAKSKQKMLRNLPSYHPIHSNEK